MLPPSRLELQSEVQGDTMPAGAISGRRLGGARLNYHSTMECRARHIGRQQYARRVVKSWVIASTYPFMKGKQATYIAKVEDAGRVVLRMTLISAWDSPETGLTRLEHDVTLPQGPRIPPFLLMP